MENKIKSITIYINKIKEINMYPYFIGLVIGIIATFAMIVTVYLLWPIRKLEGGLVEQSDVTQNLNLSTFKEVEKIWNKPRICLFLLFMYSGWIVMYLLVEISGGIQQHGWNIFFLKIIIGMSAFGWGVVSWYSARLYLRIFAPILYDKYRPYYSSGLRNNIQEAISSI